MNYSMYTVIDAVLKAFGNENVQAVSDHRGKLEIHLKGDALELTEALNLANRIKKKVSTLERTESILKSKLDILEEGIPTLENDVGMLQQELSVVDLNKALGNEVSKYLLSNISKEEVLKLLEKLLVPNIKEYYEEVNKIMKQRREEFKVESKKKYAAMSERYDKYVDKVEEIVREHTRKQVNEDVRRRNALRKVKEETEEKNEGID